ncbi:S8 family peptidase [Pedobacter heparinus]|uniref:Peptidase S8 and S53 subtilisin kexin sedolisin n=1 Tax=Pedobacter heparinus (strain ATCC 13125 / DSM 2366 / CIP 104194 / JCM 7457 / NBRC 12017 / NCIMB 9290 / NRRL B-14731 / HIM 762-3) TaxID=485917 RepID=C6XUT1_PEDHD|nr:S8 family peptidase [Pedobacter heparinus]ACU05939.1 peptidase S8 and S53 subtilisin kexin sedolisin [Pedobacter heparinus DSM 2366]
MNKMKMNFFCSGLVCLVLLTAMPFISFAQKPNWQNLDLKADSTFGISTEKAYNELLKGKKSVPVVVAVLDGGVDIEHEDLKPVVWVNKKEKAGNGKDDDKNGYIDDVHGWNFLGSSKGSVNYETLELTRLVRRDNARFANSDATSVKASELPAFEAYQKNKAEFEQELAEAKIGLERFEGIKNAIDEVVKKIGKENPTIQDFQSFKPSNDMEANIQRILLAQLKESSFEDFYKNQIMSGYDHFKSQVDYNLNLDYDPRGIVGDDPNNSKERFYGNNDVTGPDARHGSHVAGIIAAVRTNNLGIMGVADNVLIMSVRNTPNGDERDKDVANSIRYAVDKGAKVINMSFGKSYSWDKAIVDEAVKYAVSKDVVLVHAAGNDNKDLEVEPNFPDPEYIGGGKAASWITVGASGWTNDGTIKASFSNYGKTKVDVFAPGVNINSTVPGSKYEKLNGTSMASPVVAGLAALIRSYYPKLTAVQVKDIIMKSVVKVDQSVEIRDEAGTKKVPFSDLCVSGGIVNAYDALKLAAGYKK